MEGRGDRPGRRPVRPGSVGGHPYGAEERGEVGKPKPQGGQKEATEETFGHPRGTR